MVNNFKENFSMRNCANKIVHIIESHETNFENLTLELKIPLADLINEPNLVDLGIPRQGNNVANSQYLYFDGQFSILLFEVEKGGVIPPHDHGVMEILCVYKGSLNHKTYRRIDDNSISGYADLKTVENKKMNIGDIAIIAPPNDIHGFESLEDGTLGLTIVSGKYKTKRHFYNPDENSYKVKNTPNAR